MTDTNRWVHGWDGFLNKHNGRRGSANRSQRIAEPQAWDPARTLRGLKWLAAATVLVGGAWGWHAAERGLDRWVTAQVRAPVGAASVTLVDVPAWMNRTVRQELCQRVRTQTGGGPLDHEGLKRAVDALEVSPWIETVYGVRRTSHGPVHVSARYRQPVAVVEGADGYHLVSDRAVRLPGLYLRHQLEDLDLPVIVGVGAAPGRAGDVWPGSDLQAGLSLIQWLGDQPYLKQIQCIDVSGRDRQGRPHLVLRTRQGMVRWGLPPRVATGRGTRREDQEDLVGRSESGTGSDRRRWQSGRCLWRGGFLFISRSCKTTVDLPSVTLGQGEPSRF